MRRASLSGSAQQPPTRSAKAAKTALSHHERTAAEPRERDLHAATVAQVTPVNDRIKLFKFNLKDTSQGLNFLPGQWLDVFVPGVEKAGGFTITSSPRDALPQSDLEHTPFFELAIQKSPSNPPAAWLWQDVQDIQGQEINVRVGGSFVWPPPGIDINKIKRVIFIAGGVGINPMMSMLTYINQNYPALQIRLLYSTKVPSHETTPDQVLFLPRILDTFRIPRTERTNDRVELYFTGTSDGLPIGRRDEQVIRPLMELTLPKIDSETEVPVVAWTHRIDDLALSSAVGSKSEAKGTVFYVCGPPDMTDEIVGFLKAEENVVGEQVLCEKWW
ncbi:hypothetical protein CC86DRAFT_361677 [Ophiobolus disseminans]|uniref:FAD-binding FR-type domain-containing protein n=1 Tax=Ophiobolus disseminans TaxID=1469910 RepID=A0A6A6ZG24_9PLEO|nr:hypothetical protein CC86DRAFT_361677 [Ophiobolus disseminans]